MMKCHFAHFLLYQEIFILPGAELCFYNLDTDAILQKWELIRSRIRRIFIQWIINSRGSAQTESPEICTNHCNGNAYTHTCNERLKFGLLSGVLIEIDSLFSSLGELLWKLSVQKCPSVQVLIRISIMHEYVNIVNTSGPFYDRDGKPLPRLASIPWGNTRRCWPRSWWRSAGGWGWTWCAPPGWGSASAARISDIRS